MKKLTRRPLRNWVVYRFDTSPPPFDLVKRMSLHWTKRGAERKAKRLGPSLQEWRTKPGHYYDQYYYRAQRLPRLLTRRERRRRGL